LSVKSRAAAVNILLKKLMKVFWVSRNRNTISSLLSYLWYFHLDCKMCPF